VLVFSLVQCGLVYFSQRLVGALIVLWRERERARKQKRERGGGKRERERERARARARVSEHARERVGNLNQSGENCNCPPLEGPSGPPPEGSSGLEGQSPQRRPQKFQIP